MEPSPVFITAGVHSGSHHYVPNNRIVSSDPLNPENSYIQYGAGILNCLNNADIVDDYHYLFGYFGSLSTGTTTVNLTANGLFRYSFAYLYDCDPYGIQNIDVFLKDPNGNIVASSTTKTNTLEIIEYTPEISGTYTIEQQHIGALASATYFGEAWVQY